MKEALINVLSWNVVAYRSLYYTSCPVSLVDQLSFLPLPHCFTSYPCPFPLPLLCIQPYLVKFLSTINFNLFFEYVQQAENESVCCISYPRDVMCDVAGLTLLPSV